MSSLQVPLTPRRVWYVAILAGMASYLDAALLVSTGIALVLYAPSLGLSALEIGLLSALLTLSFAVGAIVGGRLGDRFGRRRVYSVTLIALAIGAALLAAAVAPAMLFVGVVIAGLALGADLPVSLALIAEEAPAGKKGRMVAFSAILWLIGILAVSGLATGVGGLGATGARILYLHIAVVAVIVLILRARMPESSEWTAAHSTAENEERIDDDRISRDSLRLLGRKPFVISLIATGLFYAIWNLAANTIGQFSTFVYVNVAHVSVQVSSLIGLISLPLGIVAGLVFMRIVDRPSRYAWFIFGAILQIAAFLIPLIFGASIVTLTIMTLAFGAGLCFAGEALYKVWSQELFSTLVRGSAQGITIAFARVIAAAAAIGTPLLVTTSPNALFVFLTACIVVSSAIGFFWVRRLPKADSVDVAAVADATSSDTSRQSEGSATR